MEYNKQFYYITQASKQIIGRHESITPSKIVVELTLGFWVSLLNSEYERLLWKDLRRAFLHAQEGTEKKECIGTAEYISDIPQPYIP